MSLEEAVKEVTGTRDEVDALVNEEIKLVVGGAGVTKRKTICLREPSIRRFGKQVKIIAGGLVEAFKDAQTQAALQRTVTDLKEGKTPTDFGLGELIKTSAMTDAVADLVADLVEEDRNYVNDEMTPKQLGRVLGAYANLVGWDTIQRFFARAMTQGTALAEKMAVVEKTAN
jgi:hypothetical protein